MENLVLIVPSTDDEFLKINKSYTKILDKFNIKYFISPYNLKILNNINMFKGIFLTGGGDFSLKYTKENLHPKANSIYPERDKFEIELVKLAYKKRISTLGICRGAQSMNLALNGKITQHIENHIQTQPKSSTSHFAYINKSSKLYKILKTEKLGVNSFHHQVIKKTGTNLSACAKSEDGFIEAIETIEDFFFIGVQWHPECLNTQESTRLFKAFINSLKS